MFCPNCGTQLPDDVMFCFNCGAKIDNSDQEQETANDGAYIRELNNFMGKDAVFIRNLRADLSDMRYCIRLAKVALRKETAQSGGGFSGMVAGIGNKITDVFSSNFRAYLIGLGNGGIAYVDEKNHADIFRHMDYTSNVNTARGTLAFTVLLNIGSAESITFSLDAGSLRQTLCGNLSEVIKDFDKNSFIFTDNMLPDYIHIRVSAPSQNTENLCELAVMWEADTLLSFSDNEIYLINCGETIPYDDIEAVFDSDSKYAFAVNEKGNPCIYEIFRTYEASPADLQWNIAAVYNDGTSPDFGIPTPDNVISAKESMYMCRCNDFVSLIIDNKPYIRSGGRTLLCGIYADSEFLYVKCGDGLRKYNNPKPIIKTMQWLSADCGDVFRDINDIQPCSTDGEIHNMQICGDGIKYDAEYHSYTDMRNFRSSSHALSCYISYTIDNRNYSFTTAYLLGIEICKAFNRVSTETRLNESDIKDLYAQYREYGTDAVIIRFLYELLRVNHLLNTEVPVDECIKSYDNGAYANLIPALMKKMIILIIGCPKIKDSIENNIVIYPHYISNRVTQSIRMRFNEAISEADYTRLRIKYVDKSRNIFSGLYSLFKDTLSVISAYIERYSSNIPEYVISNNPSDSVQLNVSANIVINECGGIENESPLVYDGFAILKQWDMLMRRAAFAIDELTEKMKLFINDILQEINSLSTDKNDLNPAASEAMNNIRTEIINLADKKYKVVDSGFNIRYDQLLDDTNNCRKLCDDILNTF